MDKIQGRELAIALISSGLVHQDYKRVVDHARDFLAFISGEGTDKMLKKFVPRESDVMFEQRLLLTNEITSAVCSSLIKPFYKVGRNDKVKQLVEIKNNEAKAEDIKKMIREFYGDSRKQRGLDYWLKTRFVELSFADPNAWLVVEWESVGVSETPKPYPVEVSSADALNFEVKNGVTKWLLIRKSVKYLAIDGRSKKAVYKDGFRYTLYSEGFSLVFTQYDKKYLAEFKPLEYLDVLGNSVDINGVNFIYTEYDTGIDYVPATRVGYMSDIITENRTFVSPLKPAQSYLRKSIKTVSELDLTMTLHAFPQKIQYVESCPGESSEKRCYHGKCSDGSTCDVCKGTGKKIHTTAQDAILLPMPEQNSPDILDLNNVLVYKAPPVDLLTFQKEYVESLGKDCHQAVFNSLVFFNSDTQKTATEVTDNMESVYDTLEPFTDKVSELWTDVVNTFAGILLVDPDSDDVNILHKYPADPKLKTTATLLSELKLVNESNAPSFLREAITNDIATIIYNGDPKGMAKYNTRKRFFPFNGKTSDEIQMLLNSSYVSERTKVLASNFDLIMNDIDKANPGFYLMTDYNKQWELVEEVVDEYLAEIQTSSDDVKPDFTPLNEEEDGDQGGNN